MAYSLKTRKYLLALLIIGWGAIFIYQVFGQLKLTRHLYHDNRLLMGTFWEVTSTDRKAGTIVFSEAGRIEGLLSKYIESSEISRLNRAGKLKVSPDTFYIIKKSKEFWQLSDGAFDITVEPIVALWGFSNRQYLVPLDKEIRSVLKLIGSDKIILHEKNYVVEFKLPGMKIDLGGIAKGFALDCAVKKLKSNNINSCLINAGGQVYALGGKFGAPWKIAIKNPREPEISGTLELKNKSASTSGDYEQFFFKAGRRYCHIINPKTGYPADSRLVSVTVITDEGLTADALSTAIFVLGKEKGEKLLEKFPGSAARIF